MNRLKTHPQDVVFTLLLVFGGLLIVVVPLAPAGAIVFIPTDFTETLVAQGFRNPTNMAIAPDGRIFVLEQQRVSGQGRGYVRVVKNGALLPTPFVQINGIDLVGEHGLLGIALDPDFATNGYVYLFFTLPGAANVSLHNEVWRYTANPANPDVALAGSGLKVIHFPPIGANVHTGGSMNFNPVDGKLYIGIGDDGRSNLTAQVVDEFRGRFLRYTIHADGTFSAPTDNPWYNEATTEINRGSWAIGLRNPFQFAIQPGTGLLYGNDVGQDIYEEVNHIERGKNYGWRHCEGPCSPANAAYTNPIHAYPHIGGMSTSGGCAITGGTFYNPPIPVFPSAYVGKYFFTDYCNDWIKYLNPANPAQVTLFATWLHPYPVALSVGPDGALYYLSRGLTATDGRLYRIDYAPFSSPVFNHHPVNRLVSAGQAASFTCSATGDGTITYQWQRQNPGTTGFTDIPDATDTSYTTPATTIADDHGARYRCAATNSFGTSFSNSALLTVVQGTPPVVSINVRINDTSRQTWLLGDTVAFTFSATDAQDGTLPPSAFTWSVDLYHQPPASELHQHPILPLTEGSAEGSFTIPTTAHDRAHLWYRINVRATDSAGHFTDAFKIVDSSLLAPAFNGSTTSTRPVVSWRPLSGALGYEVYFGTTDEPTTRFVVPGGGNIGAFMIPHTLIPTQTYYWYVKVLLPDGESTTTDTWRFDVVSPAAGAPSRNFHTTTEPVLSWSRVDFATGYRLQIATSPTFTGATLVYEEAVSGNTTLEHSVNAAPPLVEGVYYWRVAAIRTNGTLAPYSPTQMMTIKTD